MEINKFYTRVLSSLKVKVTNDGFLKIKMGDDDVVLTSEGKPMVLPTKEHINSYLVENEDGKIEVSKILYNPLNENVIKGDTLSLKKTKDLVEKRSSHSLVAAGTLLLRLANNEKLQKDTSMELNKFLMRLNEAKNIGMKAVVDEKSIENWEKLYQNSFKQDVDITKIFIKKSAKVDGIKYNRLSTVKFPVYDLLKDATKDNPKVLGVTLRPKDIKVFIMIYEYLIEGLKETSKLSVGSNDGESPGFISLFKAYQTLIKKSQKVITALKGLDSEIYDSAHITMSVKSKELDTLGIYKSDLLLIPSDIDINRRKVSIINEINNNVNKTLANTTSTTLTNNNQQQTAIQQNISQSETQQDQDRSLVDKILYGGTQPTVVTPTYTIDQIKSQQTPTQYLPQNQMLMGNQAVVPGGINTVLNQQTPIQYLPQNQMLGFNNSVPVAGYGQYPQQPQPAPIGTNFRY